jgi:hypothetical protein
LAFLGVFLCKSVLYGVFACARRALNSQKRRSPARAVMAAADRQGAPPPEAGEVVRVCGHLPLALCIAGRLILQVRKTPSWPRSWANFSTS